MEKNMKAYFRKIEPVLVANASNTMTYRDGGGGGLPKAVGYIVSYRPSWSTKEMEIQYAPRNPKRKQSYYMEETSILSSLLQHYS